MTSGLVRIDLHVHTRHSHDSAAPVSSVLQRCRDGGLGMVAITDHDSIRGGLEAREKGGFPVIVGEEIKSAQGDIIGLFLEEEVPPNLTPLETAQRVKDQGGLVGVPHPFDRIRPTALGRKGCWKSCTWLISWRATTLIPFLLETTGRASNLPPAIRCRWFLAAIRIPLWSWAALTRRCRSLNWTARRRG